MKISTIAFTLCLIVLLGSCRNTKQSNDKDALKEKSEIKYSKGFTIQHFDKYTQITVRNPWDTTQTMEKYILVDRNIKLPTNLPDGNIVRIPVQRVATCSSIFAGEYKQFGDIDKIIAVSEPEYYNITEIKKGLETGKIANLGITTSLNTEKLIASKPDVLIISPFEVSMHDKYKKMGICVIKDASYMEESPLGRTEWMKFEAAFLGKDSLANTIFSKIEKHYLDLCKEVNKTKNRPTVFGEKKYGDAWYVAGGNSYMGNFMKDAGANYLWSDLKINGSKPFPFETVFSKALNADFWLIKYNNSESNLTYKQLGEEYDLYKNFAAYKNKHVFAVNSGNTPYYEQGPLEPDVVLSDFIKIFHPEILPDYQPKYYFGLKE